MFITVSQSDFHDAFINANRKENFSWEGRKVLFYYLEEIEADCGAPIEFDVIALCCDYSEDTPADIADNYRIDLSQCDPDDTDDIRETVLEYLQENTSVVGETDATIIYAAF
jgi:hypothetical protein